MKKIKVVQYDFLTDTAFELYDGIVESIKEFKVLEKSSRASLYVKVESESMKILRLEDNETQLEVSKDQGSLTIKTPYGQLSFEVEVVSFHSSESEVVCQYYLKQNQEIVAHFEFKIIVIDKMLN